MTLRTLRTRLARLERGHGGGGRCPACPPIEILDWREGEPEPRSNCPRCGRPADCIVIVAQIVEAGETSCRATPAPPSRP